MRTGFLALVFTGALACAHREAPPPETPAAQRAEPEPRATTVAAPSPPPAVRAGSDAFEVGLATWYGGKLAGRRTASGERFDPSQMTAAHRTLPFGTWVEVTRPDTGQSVRVRINDRGPFGDGAKVIDLSRGAAERIGLVRVGVVRVALRVVASPR